MTRRSRWNASSIDSPPTNTPRFFRNTTYNTHSKWFLTSTNSRLECCYLLYRYLLIQSATSKHFQLFQFDAPSAVCHIFSHASFLIFITSISSGLTCDMSATVCQPSRSNWGHVETIPILRMMMTVVLLSHQHPLYFIMRWHHSLHVGSASQDYHTLEVVIHEIKR